MLLKFLLVKYLTEFNFLLFHSASIKPKVKAGDSHKKGKLNGTYPKYNVQALKGESTSALGFLEKGTVFELQLLPFSPF